MRVEFGDARLPHRFWDKVKIDESGCWMWTASHKSNGYGEFCQNGRNVRAHRVAYETLCGQVPDGLQLDHLCRNRGCVNPQHLEAVTGQENCRRGDLATHAKGTGFCRNGTHRVSPANVYTRASGLKQCRACLAESQSRQRIANRDKLRERQRAYLAANCDRINARRRELYALARAGGS